MVRPPSGRVVFGEYLLVTICLVLVVNIACTDQESSLGLEVINIDNSIAPPQVTVEPHLIEPTPKISEGDVISPSDNRIPGGNLRPFTPPDWKAPLLVSSRPNLNSEGSTSPIENPYISWALVRDGEFLLTTQFFVDLYVNDLFLERWQVDTLNPGVPKTMSDWNEILNRIHLDSGEHQLVLVIDATDLILEEDETDNIYSTKFFGPQEGIRISKPMIAVERLPNLTPFIPPGWQSPIRVVSNGGRLDEFPIGETVKIQVAFKNSGLSSVSQNFLAYLYLDEIPVAKFSERNLIADEAILTSEWSGLNEVLKITSGSHTFKLVVDPTNLVHETVEMDNTVSTSFVWGQYGESHKELKVVLPKTKSGSIEPFVPPSWDAPLIITSVQGNFSSSDLLNYFEPAFVHWAVINPGDRKYDKVYNIELRLDGFTLNTWNRSGLDPKETDVVFDWVLLPPLEVGRESTLELFGRLSDGFGRIEEVLLAKRSIRWSAGITLTNSQTTKLNKLALIEQLTPLESLLSTNEPLVSHLGLGETDSLLDLADAVYYEIYSRRLNTENLKIHLLSQSEYSLWISIECRDRSNNLSKEVKEEYFNNCLRIDEFGGFFTFWRSNYHIVVQSERPPIKVLETLAHELGHFRQSITNPKLDSITQSLDILAFREAQAYIHQVLFIRTLGALTGRDLLSYPKLDGFEWFIDRGIEQFIYGSDSNEHDRGRLLLWLAVLTDPKLGNARNVLLSNKYLTPTAAKEVFFYFLSFRPDKISSYVTTQVVSKNTYEKPIQEMSNSRLSFGVSYWNEGSPYLRETGLLLP